MLHAHGYRLISDSFDERILCSGGSWRNEKSWSASGLHSDEELYDKVQNLALAQADSSEVCVLHGTALRIDTLSVLILGDRGSGKTSMARQAAISGCDVIADDLVVMEGTSAYCGPRLLAVRGEIGNEDSSPTFEIVSPVNSINPISRIAVLGWGCKNEMSVLGQSQLAYELNRHRAFSTTGAFPAQLETMPAVSLRRPFDAPVRSSFELLKEAIA